MMRAGCLLHVIPWSLAIALFAVIAAAAEFSPEGTVSDGTVWLLFAGMVGVAIAIGYWAGRLSDRDDD